jgi:hypothetical protein
MFSLAGSTPARRERKRELVNGHPPDERGREVDANQREARRDTMSDGEPSPNRVRSSTVSW